MTNNTLTEAEAGLRWCPMARGEFCVSIGCMAWRITGEQILDRQTSERKPLADAAKGDRIVSRGYCGLAGKP